MILKISIRYKIYFYKHIITYFTVIVDIKIYTAKWGPPYINFKNFESKIL
nr:MAG TPA: hypothetical protein [Caudoviricetes sp.]